MSRATINLHNGDCMDALREMPDNAFELAIVDPPYGMAEKMDGTTGAGRIMRKWKRSECWDNAPDAEYFAELKRVSSNYIIWGANNFIEHLEPTTNFVFWYKHQPAPNFADGELAWTSFDKTCKCFDYMCFGAHGQDKGGKQHPTQKPVALYKWLLANYAKDGDRILDTHGGSMSIAIACWDAGYDLDLWELDKDYYEAGCARLRKHQAQGQFDI